MRERQAIVAAWTTACAAGREAVLATVVRVEGSSYRGVGARMLVLDQGERVGGVSGGCLEQEVARKAFWLTAEGPRVEAFSTRSDDDARPYGMGCEGVVHVLFERLSPKSPYTPIALIEACAAARAAGALATVLACGQPQGERAQLGVGAQLALWPDGSATGPLGDAALTMEVTRAAQQCVRTGSFERTCEHQGARVVIAFERIAPPRSLVIFGAGDDAVPLVRIAKELGWHVTVADGRAQFANAARFPSADAVVVRQLGAPLEGVDVPLDAACVVMSHSFEQDARALAMLAPLPLPYLGLLGPRARRDALLGEVGAPRFAATSGLRGPVGLDLGSETPEEIALAVVAEALACFSGRAGGALSERVASPDAVASVRADATRRGVR